MNKQMSNVIALVLFCISILVLLGCEGKTSATVENPVERGKYLVTVSGCGDCHTPKIQGPGGVPMEDTTRVLSGHPADMPYPIWSPQDLQQRNAMTLSNAMFTSWTGPWGVSFAANLTPDDETGSGLWTEDMFIEAMRTGKHLGKGRPILPPMPWFNLQKMTDSDLKAVWAYLRSLPPVHNQVPTPIPPAGTPEGE